MEQLTIIEIENIYHNYDFVKSGMGRGGIAEYIAAADASGNSTAEVLGLPLPGRPYVRTCEYERTDQGIKCSSIAAYGDSECGSTDYDGDDRRKFWHHYRTNSSQFPSRILVLYAGARIGRKLDKSGGVFD